MSAAAAKRLKPVTGAELQALSVVLPWVRVAVKGGHVACVPIEPEMRDRLVATIRALRAKDRRQRRAVGYEDRHREVAPEPCPRQAGEGARGQKGFAVVNFIGIDKASGSDRTIIGTSSPHYFRGDESIRLAGQSNRYRTKVSQVLTATTAELKTFVRNGIVWTA